MSDANMVFVSKTDMIELLKQAFEEGWNGYLDLKDATADKLFEDYLETKKEQVRAEPNQAHFVSVDNVSFPASTGVWETSPIAATISGGNYNISTEEHVIQYTHNHSNYST